MKLWPRRRNGVPILATAAAEANPDAADAHRRIAAAGNVISAALLAQTRREPDARNGEVVNLCLDLRNALYGAPGDAIVPAATLPRRYPTPVVAGPDGVEYPGERV